MGFDWYFGYFGLRLREKLGSNRVVEGLQDFGFEIPPVSTFNNREFDKLIHSFEKFIDGGYHKKTKSKTILHYLIIISFIFFLKICFFSFTQVSHSYPSLLNRSSPKKPH